MNITYPINALPRAIPLCLGVQSEYGARPISIDVSEWVGRWPDIIVSVQPVRPGEDESYPAAGVTRSGSIVTWTPTAYDTEIPGTGSVEIIGLADGVKIIRTGAATTIAPTKSSVSKAPEDPIAAWADSVIRAGEQAKAGAEEALLSAQAANKSANNANASAVQAQSAHRAAANAASQAATYRTDAVNAMNAAKNSQTQANTSERNASAAAAAAYKSQTKAEAAAKRAEDAANSMGGGGTVSPGDGKLKADAIMCDKSGEVVSIADASEMDALSVVSHIDSPEGVTEITLTRTGKNIWGGMALAQSIASQVDGAVLDVDAKTVTYDAGKIKAVNVFDKFELGKRYTVIFARDESKSKGTTANIRIIYDNGGAENITFNSGNTAVVTTAANKNVEKLLGYNFYGPTCLLYEQCGIFEGVLTETDFVPYEAETFTVALPETVTDGTFDWATGVLTINQDDASRTVQLDAQPIAMRDRYNTMWSSTGQTDVRYVADTKAYVDGHGADADAEYAENAGYADNAGRAEEAGDAQTVKGRDIAAEVDSLSEENAAQNTSLKQLSDEVRGINGVTETVIVPIDDSDIIDGSLIMEGTGSQVNSANWTCTDWIPVSFDGGSNITAKCVLYGSGAFVFYNSLKNPILSISGNNCSDYGIRASAEPQSVVLPCPKQTAYIRMSMLKSAYNTDGKGYELSGYVTDSLSNMIAAANRNIADVERRLNLNVTNFHDKKVLVFGDSISADYYGNYPKWVTHLTEERFFDAEKTTNDSTHATGFVARYSEQPNDFITRMEAISAADTYDIVIVFGGINDYIQSIPMGESGGDKLTHFKPAVDYFFATLAERFVNARLLVLLPMRTEGYGNKNGAGCTQADYAEYIRTVAMQYALPVLNLMDDSGFNPKLPVFKNRWTLTEYSGGDGVTGDGVHPNEEYERRFLAPMIRAFLQSVM